MGALFFLCSLILFLGVTEQRGESLTSGQFHLPVYTLTLYNDPYENECAPSLHVFIVFASFFQFSSYIMLTVVVFQLLTLLKVKADHHI